MAYVAVNVLTVPDGRGMEMLSPVARARVEKAPGFEHFELLLVVGGHRRLPRVHPLGQPRGVRGVDALAVVLAGHGQASGSAWIGSAPAATGLTIWSFEVVQDADPA